MSDTRIVFDDGDAYERSMAAWSRPAGAIFLDWLAPAQGLRWIDVGCGNGAFTEMLLRHCAPAEVQGIDPSPGQLAFARTRPGSEGVRFLQGDAMALPFEAARFDAAAMALVIFFVPDPAKGVAEMARVVRPGGLVAAYAWDILGGGFPYRPVQEALRALGRTPALPPRLEAAAMDNLRALWSGAGLEALETREIEVERRFADFEAFWAQCVVTSSLRAALEQMAPEELARLREETRARLRVDGTGGIVHAARANAIRGRVPA